MIKYKAKILRAENNYNCCGSCGERIISGSKYLWRRVPPSGISFCAKCIKKFAGEIHQEDIRLLEEQRKEYTHKKIKSLSLSLSKLKRGNRK